MIECDNCGTPTHPRSGCLAVVDGSATFLCDKCSAWIKGRRAQK